MKNRWSVHAALKEFEALLKKQPDHPKFLLIYTNFLRQFLRCHVDEHALPTIEVMTVLKNEKPVIFTLLKKQRNSIFSFLTQIDMEYDEAKSRLEAIKHSIPYHQR